MISLALSGVVNVHSFLQVLGFISIAIIVLSIWFKKGYDEKMEEMGIAEI